MTAPDNRIGPPAPRPCTSCPYRQDVPSGVWAATEYEKLRAYDRPTMEQPPAVFLCHQRNRDAAGSRVCAGWASVHDGPHLLALRVAVLEGRMVPEDVDATIDYSSPVPLFASGAEAAEHGRLRSPCRGSGRWRLWRRSPASGTTSPSRKDLTVSGPETPQPAAHE